MKLFPHRNTTPLINNPQELTNTINKTAQGYLKRTPTPQEHQTITDTIHRHLAHKNITPNHPTTRINKHTRHGIRLGILSIIATQRANRHPKA